VDAEHLEALQRDIHERRPVGPARDEPFGQEPAGAHGVAHADPIQSLQRIRR
jgi:hypothetical protein